MVKRRIKKYSISGREIFVFLPPVSNLSYLIKLVTVMLDYCGQVISSVENRPEYIGAHP